MSKPSYKSKLAAAALIGLLSVAGSVGTALAGHDSVLAGSKNLKQGPAVKDDACTRTMGKHGYGKKQAYSKDKHGYSKKHKMDKHKHQKSKHYQKHKKGY